MNAVTGQLTSQPLDREYRAIHHLTVAAVDAGQPPLSALITVIVHVIDVNDHQPQFQVHTYFLNMIREEAAAAAR